MSKPKKIELECLRARVKELNSIFCRFPVEDEREYEYINKRIAELIKKIEEREAENKGE